MARKGKNLKLIFLQFSGYFIIGSSIFTVDQIRRIKKTIDKATLTDVLSIDQIQPSYISIEDPIIQDQIEAGNLITKEHLKLTRIHRWLNDKIEESFIFRNWYSYKKNLAWRYLKLAKDDNKSYRLRAVKTLAALKNLTDADYQQLAQSCDIRTAVGLARTVNNAKFFMDPPYYKQKPDRFTIVKHFHNFLMALDEEAKHPCLQYFISKVFNDLPETDYKGFDDDLSIKYNQSEYIPLCIEALLHHSSIGNNAESIVTLGGLPLLIEVYKYLQLEEPDNVDCLIMLSRLMSNISIYDSCLKGLYVSGWIKILVLLSQHKDIRVAAPAERALINMDSDYELYGGDIKYCRRIYPLYPTQRTKFQPKLDVVFIHGLLGGVFVTWRQRDSGLSAHKSPLGLLEKPRIRSFKGIFDSEHEKASEHSFDSRNPLEPDFFLDGEDMRNHDNIEKDFRFVLDDIPIDANTDNVEPFFSSETYVVRDMVNFSKCWPKDWLSADCPDTRIIGVNYETNISMWTPMCPTIPGSRNLRDRSTHIMRALMKAGVGRRPIVWVAHSMGGLIVKDILVQAAQAEEDSVKNALLQNTKGIIFYSTPHKGSHLAAFNPTSQMIIWPSIEVQELRENSPALLELHKQFLSVVKNKPIKIVTFAERESTFITSMKFELKFVDAISADPDIGEMYGIPLDHLCICKPACKQSFLYQKVLRLIKDVLKEIEIRNT